jgi:hypothetical protein
MKLFHQTLRNAIRNDELQSFNQDMNGYFPRDQDGNPVLVSNDDGSITIGYIQNKKRKAIKVWEKTDSVRSMQYASAANIIRLFPSRFFSPFEFREKGLLLEQQQLDFLITEWINHEPLKDYIFKRLGRPEQLLAVADEFAQMQTELQQQGLGQYFFGPQSIIVIPEAKLLVGDYNFSKAGDSYKSNGLLYDNYISTLCTYISIKVLSQRPYFWDRYQLRTRGELLFTNTDLANITQSAIYLDLKGISEEIDKLLEALKIYCEKNTASVKLYLIPTQTAIEEVKSQNITEPPVTPQETDFLVDVPPHKEVIGMSNDLIPEVLPSETMLEATQAENSTSVNYSAAAILAGPRSTDNLAEPQSDNKAVDISDSSFAPSIQTSQDAKRSRRKIYGIAACVVLLILGSYLLKNQLSGSTTVSIDRSISVANNQNLVPETTESKKAMPDHSPNIPADTTSLKQNNATVPYDENTKEPEAKNQTSSNIERTTQADAVVTEGKNANDAARPTKVSVTNLDAALKDTTKMRTVELSNRVRAQRTDPGSYSRRQATLPQNSSQTFHISITPQ